MEKLSVRWPRDNSFLPSAKIALMFAWLGVRCSSSARANLRAYLRCLRALIQGQLPLRRAGRVFEVHGVERHEKPEPCSLCPWLAEGP
eukprot:7362690-Pyramimonas_sp.AAC.1